MNDGGVFKDWFAWISLNLAWKEPGVGGGGGGGGLGGEAKPRHLAPVLLGLNEQTNL